MNGELSSDATPLANGPWVGGLSSPVLHLGPDPTPAVIMCIKLRYSLIAVAHEATRLHSLEMRRSEAQTESDNEARRTDSCASGSAALQCTRTAKCAQPAQMCVTDSVTKHTHGPDTNKAPDTTKLYSGARLPAS